MLEDSLEVLAAQDIERRVLHRDDVRGTRLIVDQCHLAEELAFTKHGENYFPSVFADPDDFDLTLRDDVQRVAGIVFEEDDGVLGIRAVARDFHDPLEVNGGKLTEKWDLLQHVRS